jgi:hypothetical protein
MQSVHLSDVGSAVHLTTIPPQRISKPEDSLKKQQEQTASKQTARTYWFIFRIVIVLAMSLYKKDKDIKKER